jgi:uncharacterized repeat protein (TIGR02543 family)
VLEEALNLNKLTLTCTDCNQQPVTYTLNVSVNGNGSVSPSSGTYDQGESISITATADAGYQFDGWSGDASGAANPIDITMDADINITANFSQIPNNDCGEILSGTLQHEICEPTEGQIFTEGEPIIIKSNFSSDISEVQAFHGNWQWIGSSSSAPYEITWSDATVGTHTLTVRGSDASGNRTANNTVTIEVVQVKSATIGDADIKSQDVNIYPNPVNGNTANISFSGTAEVQIFTAQGTLINISEAKDGIELNVDELPSGTYLVRIVKSESVSIQKLIRQ